MALKSTRRIVTGHDAQGKAVALFDAPVQAKQRSAGGNGMTMLWVTTEFPVDMSVSTTARRRGRRSASRQRHDFPHRRFRAGDRRHGAVDHHKILQAMGIDPATQGYARHANTHRTRTIDYAMVLEGEIDMLLDDSEVHVKAGDVLVQQGTNHAWVNNSGKPCRIAFILIDAKTPPAWQQGWKP